MSIQKKIDYANEDRHIKRINFANYQEPEQSIRLINRKEYLVKVDSGNNVEFLYFELLNDNYQWELIDFGQCDAFFREVKSEWSKVFGKFRTPIKYKLLKDSYLIPKTHFSVTKE